MTLTPRTLARPSTGRRGRLALIAAAASLLATGITTTVTTEAAHAATWEPIAGAAKDIGIGTANSTHVWAIGFFDSHVYKRNGTAWDAAGEVGERIAVDGSGNAWVVQANGTIRFRNPQSPDWGTWPGTARDIAIAPNGSIWRAGTNGVVYQWSGASWTNRGGSDVKRIDVDSANLVWVVQNDGDVYRRSNTTGAWTFIAGGAQDVGGGTGGSPWRTSNNATDGTVYRRTSGTWNNENGVGQSIDVDTSGRAWVTQSNGAIWRSNPLP
jgi:hypothetical protein